MTQETGKATNAAYQRRARLVSQEAVGSLSVIGFWAWLVIQIRRDAATRTLKNSRDTIHNVSQITKIDVSQVGKSRTAILGLWIAEAHGELVERAELGNARSNDVQVGGRAGCPGVCSPKSLAPGKPYTTTTARGRAWTRDDTWRILHDTLRDCLRQAEGRKVAPAAAIIDSQSIKPPDQAGERGHDAGKKISDRKRHLAVDTLA
jgi:transposase